MSGKQENVYKVTLSSGRVAYLREYKLRHRETALQSVAQKAGNNEFILSSLVSSELLRILLRAIEENGQKRDLSYKDVMDLDALFSISEINEMQVVISKLSGVAGGNIPDPQVELESVTTQE